MLPVPPRFTSRGVPLPAPPAAERERIGGSAILLALLITSYFYVLPLGRYQVAGIDTDFRIYDFVFILFVLLVSGKHWPAMRKLYADRTQFHYWAIRVAALVWFSLLLTGAASGLPRMLTAAIRAFRFTAYLLTPTFVVAIANTWRRQRFLLRVLFVNILVQAGLAFAQGEGWLPNFWPDYWLVAFRTRSVGTLSPHHLQIAVVMMLGIPLALTLFRTSRILLVWVVLAGALAVMLTVIVFSGMRTVWVAVPILAIAYLYVHRIHGVTVLLVAAAAVGSWLWLARSHIQDPMQDIYYARVGYYLEQGGPEELIREREAVYFDDILVSVARKPWFLITGTGFENISYLTAATGAHNNYLQAWLELGIVGLVVYLRFLKGVLDTLREAARQATDTLEKSLAQDAWVAWVGVLVTMLANETLWAQYSMFTLTGQILAVVGLAVCPLNWSKVDLTSAAPAAAARAWRANWRPNLRG